MSRMLQSLDSLSPKPRNTLLGATAAHLSRLALPPLAVAVSWPRGKGTVRVAGKGFWPFYAVACCLWVLATFGACLVLEAIIARTAGSTLMLPAQIGPARPMPAGIDELVGDARLVLRFVASPSAWVHAPLWFAISLVLALVDARLSRAPFSLFGLFLAAPLRAAIAVGGSISLILATAALYSGAFPGLLEGGVPTACFPWWVWFSAAWVLLIYRGATDLNPRLREFTVDLRKRYGYFDATAWLVPGSIDADGPADELEEARFDFLRKCRVLFEREGLNTLLRPDNPERHYYTARQRDELDKTYVHLVEAVGRRERMIRWANERRSARADAPRATIDDPGRPIPEEKPAAD